MMFRGKSVVGGSLLNTAAGLLSLTAGFGASVIVARALGVEATGIVAFALYVMVLATALSDGGMPQAALRFVAGSTALEDSHSTLFTALTRRFVATTTIAAICILGYALWLASAGQNSAALVWVATTVLFLSYAYSTLSLGAAHGLGQFGTAASRTLAGCIIQPIAVLFGGLLLGPAGAILGHAVRHLPLAVALPKYLGAGSAPDSLITEPMRKYAKHNWLTNALWFSLGSRAELAVIGLSFSFVAVGYYAIGLTMNGLVLQLATFLLASLVPYFGFLHDTDDTQKLVLAYQRSMRWLGIILAPICFGGAAVAPVLIPLVFGDAFAPAVPMAEILIAFSFAAGLTSVPARMMLGRNRSGASLRLSVIWGAISIALMIALVPFFGGFGAAWVKAAISVATFVSFAWYCRARLAIPLAIGEIVKIAVAGLLCAVAARLCIEIVPGLAGLGLGLAAGAIVYSASLLLLSVLPARERVHLTKWISRQFAQSAGARDDEKAEQEGSELQVGRAQ